MNIIITPEVAAESMAHSIRAAAYRLKIDPDFKSLDSLFQEILKADTAAHDKLTSYIRSYQEWHAHLLKVEEIRKRATPSDEYLMMYQKYSKQRDESERDLREYYNSKYPVGN